MLLRRALVPAVLAAFVMAWSAASAAAATPASVKFQLRGHLPELGERPSLRVFDTNAAYEAFRTGLGDANLFPSASLLFMSFDKDLLVLYARGSDAGGRCLSRTAFPQDGVALTLALQWEAGSCGAPISAHYPFLLLSLSRASADGGAWVPAGGRSVCASAGPDTDACATVGAVASPSPTASPAATTTASATAVASPSPAPTRTIVPTATPAPTATPTSSRPPAATSAPPTLVAAASGTPTALEDRGPNYFLVAIAVGFVLLVGIAILRSRTET